MHDGRFDDVDSITAGLGVSYTYIDNAQAPATAMDDGTTKLILITRSFLEPIEDETLRVAIEKGLRVHEGLEHIYGEIPKRNKACEERGKNGLNKSFFHVLDNILGDVFIEAKGQRDYPALTKYLSLLNTYLWDLTIQNTRRDQDIAPLIKTMRALTQAVVFGDVQGDLLDDNVKEDLDFIIPCVFLARRGNGIEAVIQACDDIYHYLDAKYKIPKNLTATREMKIPSSSRGNNNSCSSSEGSKDSDVTKENNGAPDRQTGHYVNIIPWHTKEELEHATKAALKETREQLEEEKRKGLTDGLLGGPDHATLTPPTIRDVTFYLNTLRKHAETIRRLQAIFKRLAGKRGFVPAREGELNLKPSIVQQAYLDSFKTGEDEHDYYLILKHAIPDIDLVLACDSSGSTYGTAELFSEAAICILEAAKRVGKIRTAALSFGDGIRILKDFHEPVEAGRFYPKAGGGTPIGEALEQAMKFRWRRGNGIKRTLVLASDGYPDSWSKVDGPIEEMKRQHILPVALCLGVEANEDYRTRFNQVYEIDDASQLTETFSRAFIENALLRR